MFNNWKQRLTRGWNFMRLFRLVLAIIVLTEAWKNAEVMFGLLGLVLLFQSVLDVGCCGSAGCDTNYTSTKTKSSVNTLPETKFEEIKN